MSKRLWFTLLELLIVMVIMGILLAMTMNFGADRVKDLDRQSVSNQFIDAFNSLVGQARSSSYLYNQKFSKLIVHFDVWDHAIVSSLSGSSTSASYTWFESSVFTIDHISVNNLPLSGLNVIITPYAIGCQMQSSSSASGFVLSTHIKDTPYCYHLDPALCVLKKTECR